MKERIDMYLTKKEDGKLYFNSKGIEELEKLTEKYPDSTIKKASGVSKNSFLNWISNKPISRRGIDAVEKMIAYNESGGVSLTFEKADLSSATIEELLDELNSRGFVFDFYKKG